MNPPPRPDVAKAKSAQAPGLSALPYLIGAGFVLLIANVVLSYIRVETYGGPFLWTGHAVSLAGILFVCALYWNAQSNQKKRTG